jgi:hypothetical protein
MQVAINLSEKQLHQLLPIYAMHCERMRNLGVAAADTMQTIQAVRQVGCGGQGRQQSCKAAINTTIYSPHWPLTLSCAAHAGKMAGERLVVGDAAIPFCI